MLQLLGKPFSPFEKKNGDTEKEGKKLAYENVPPLSPLRHEDTCVIVPPAPPTERDTPPPQMPALPLVEAAYAKREEEEGGGEGGGAEEAGLVLSAAPVLQVLLDICIYI